MVIFFKSFGYINNYFIYNVRIEQTLENFSKDKGNFRGYFGI